MMSDEVIMENNYMFVILSNLSLIRHLVFPQCFFSSPEHNMLKGTFQGGDVSVVHHLLPNRWANFDQTWQECSLGGPLQKLFTEFDSIKNSGCHGKEIEFFKQFFKILLL